MTMTEDKVKLLSYLCPISTLQCLSSHQTEVPTYVAYINPRGRRVSVNILVSTTQINTGPRQCAYLARLYRSKQYNSTCLDIHNNLHCREVNMPSVISPINTILKRDFIVRYFFPK